MSTNDIVVEDGMNFEVVKIEKNIMRWRNDPLAFCKEVIHFEPSEQQALIIDAVKVPGAWVTVKSGHGVGKTSTLACLALWFISCFDDCKVPVTHPAREQLKSTMWPELRKWHSKMENPFRDAIEINSEKCFIKARPDRFIQARTSRPDNPDALQGFHAEHLLFLIDEASGVSTKIFEVAFGALTTADARFLLTGNPTHTSGFFWQTFNKYRDSWLRFTLSCIDSPNVKREYIEKMQNQYGRESNEFRVRVLGEFPTASSMQFIDSEVVRSAIERYVAVKEDESLYDYAPKVLGVDVARYGDDSSCVYMRQGIYSEMVYKIKDTDTHTLACKVATLYVEYQCSEIFVDLAGVGAGVFDYLYNHGYPAHGIEFGSKATESIYYNKRAELWGRMREWLKHGGVLEDSEDMESDLTVIMYEYDVRDRIKLERKESIKKRGYPSPDNADALALTFAGDYLGGGTYNETLNIKTSEEDGLFTV